MSAARNPNSDLVGRIIAGKFVIESILGGGAMATVFKAKHLGLDKPIALKIMHRALAVDPLFAARFHREAHTASRLDHPASIRIIDYGQEQDDLLYIAMDLVDGRDLHAIILDEWPLGDARVVGILSQVLAALAVAHDMGIVHRDLKPENIMIVRGLDDEGHPADLVKVCDFGIAKITEPRADKLGERPDAHANITATGFVVGTPEYMAPEQARGEPVDARADLYAVGAILYRLLTRVPPFQAESALGVAVKHIFEEPPPPSQRVAVVNPHLEAVCLKAIRKDPSQRYQTAREMRADLRAALSKGPCSAVADSPRQIIAPDSHAAPRSSAGEAPPLASSAIEAAPTLVAPIAGLAPSSVPSVRGALVVKQSGVAHGTPPSRSALRWSALAIGATLVAVVAAATSSRPAPRAAAVTAPAAAPAPPAPAPTPARATTEERPAEPAVFSPMPAPTPARVAAPRGLPAAAPHDPPAIVTATAPAAPPAPDPPAAAPPPAPPPPPAPAPSATATAAPALRDVASARVTVSGVSATNGLSAASVRNALVHVSFTRCYHDALRASGKPASGTARLHLVLDDTGHVTSATVSGLGFLPGASSCIEAAARGVRVPGVDTGDAMVDASLTFSLEG